MPGPGTAHRHRSEPEWHHHTPLPALRVLWIPVCIPVQIGVGG